MGLVDNELTTRVAQRPRHDSWRDSLQFRKERAEDKQKKITNDFGSVICKTQTGKSGNAAADERVQLGCAWSVYGGNHAKQPSHVRSRRGQARQHAAKEQINRSIVVRVVRFYHESANYSIRVLRQFGSVAHSSSRWCNWTFSRGRATRCKTLGVVENKCWNRFQAAVATSIRQSLVCVKPEFW